MNIEVWLAFVAAACALVAIPGPTMVTVMRYSIAQGKSAAMPLILAVTLGDSTALVLSLLGLGAIMQASALVFTAVKFLGGLYLLFLGVKLFRSHVSISVSNSAVKPESKWQLFYNTYLVTALNPKGIMFFVAFLPQFVDVAGNVNQQLFMLGSTFVIIATLNAAAYALFANSARKAFLSAKMQKLLNYCGGGFLTVSGIFTLLLKRPV